jgi:phage terminase large subunit-like protein
LTHNQIDWQGREVYLGVDLSMTTDNTAVAMVCADENNRILTDCFCFIPEGRIEEKNKVEKLDYRRFIEHGKCFACGNKTIDYGFVEDFVLKIEKKFNVTIRAIGFDRYNAISSAQKWNQKYNTVEIRQHSDTLHPPTKLLTEKITNGEFGYEKNILLEINFENAKCAYDTNMNRYVNKKKSSGKVDMVAALINAVYLLQQDIIFEGSGTVYAV